MSDVYVVLGMHRSGTSLVSSMIHRSGIPMCRYRCSKGDKTQPHGYFEDHDFVVINRKILKQAGGNWHNPPPPREIQISADDLYGEMSVLISERDDGRRAWGWKDPRTTLTAIHWHKTLRRLGHTPHYVLAVRDQTGVVKSLLNRNKGTALEWATLYQTYQERTFAFLRSLKESYAVIQFSELIHGDSEACVTRLAEFIGRPEQTDTMLAQIHRRD